MVKFKVLYTNYLTIYVTLSWKNYQKLVKNEKNEKVNNESVHRMSYAFHHY